MTDKFITIKWHVSDVMHEMPWLNAKQAENVLRAALLLHDCNTGINWDVLNAVADNLYPE